MKPWERRLRDLSTLLNNCGINYSNPELFRQNLNQFLQTSRTVTFIIQKNKSEIANFDSWYQASVLIPWKHDPIMTWAKDSRNTIEKEGDLDMHSSLSTKLIYSYDEQEDLAIQTTREDLLSADIQQLIKNAIRKIHPNLLKDATLAIQREWIANTLPFIELIQALLYIYTQIHNICSSLANHLNQNLDESIPHPKIFDPIKNDYTKLRLVSFSTNQQGRFASYEIKPDPKALPPATLEKLKTDLHSISSPESMEDSLEFHREMAQLLFNETKNHIPMLFFYDKDWNILEVLMTEFSDQASKYIFWRRAADRALHLQAYAVVWTAESWIRDPRNAGNKNVSELPIIGEQLHIIALDAESSLAACVWDITRNKESTIPTLSLAESERTFDSIEHLPFLMPISKALKTVNNQK